MRYLSVCSGIEAATVAWHPLKWEPIAFSEIDKFPSKVLNHHYPTVPNLGDMTKYQEWNLGTVDLVVGGTPCQSFSVAGLRKGLADPRGNLALVYCGILDRFKPKWCVWENVPGVLSSNGGRDFGSFLGALAELGYGFAYRVLDAQYFGVPQRRRRVFVVGHLGDWRPAATILFEPESLRGDPPPRRKAGQRVAPTVTHGPPFSRTGNERVEHEAIVTARMVSFGEYVDDGTASAMKARDYKDATDLVAQTYSMITANTGSKGLGVSVEVAPTLDLAQPAAVAQSMAVRRLTPTECERLQGFPDNYTNIQGASNTTRYKALGNSMAVPVMRWIGKRIKEI